MTKYSKHIKKKLLIFDFDGVLADSIDNMEISWSHVKDKFNLKSNFDDYKKHLGLPFEEIIKIVIPATGDQAIVAGKTEALSECIQQRLGHGFVINKTDGVGAPALLETRGHLFYQAFVDGGIKLKLCIT